MIEKEELCNNIVKFLKETRPYDFNDCYSSEEEAYDNFYFLISKSPKGPLLEMSEEIHEFLIYNDLRNKEMKEQFQMAVKLSYELNIYYNNFLEKENEIN